MLDFADDLSFGRGGYADLGDGQHFSCRQPEADGAFDSDIGAEGAIKFGDLPARRCPPAFEFHASLSAARRRPCLRLRGACFSCGLHGAGQDDIYAVANSRRFIELLIRVALTFTASYDLRIDDCDSIRYRHYRAIYQAFYLANELCTRPTACVAPDARILRMPLAPLS